MSREIEFRGKRIDTGDWVYGDLTRYSKKMSYITVDLIEGEVYKTYTASVGQYTGLRDKNGTKIYEGDVIEINEGICEVIFINGGFGIKDGTFDYLCEEINEFRWLADNEIDVEVIGNVHDNPELLEAIT